MIELLPLFTGVILAQIAPGPNLLATASVAMGAGRRAGLLTAAGIATGVFVWAILFSLGVGAVLASFPAALVAMKLLGGLYLMWLGASALRRACQRGNWRAPAPGSAAKRHYLNGLGIVLTNPKAAMMWVAVSMYLAGIGVTGTDVLPVGLGVSASALLVYGTYALLFSTAPVSGIYTKGFRWIEGAFGAVFGLIGARLAFDGLRALK